MTDNSNWISLGEAAKLLGVHPTTVRNWADQGELPFRRTPGRHRRFNKEVLREWAAQNKVQEKQEPSGQHNAQLIVEYALGHTRYNISESGIQQAQWYGKLSDAGIQQSRAFGRRILEALLKHLEDQFEEGEELAEARRIGLDYAKLLKGEGLTLSQAIQGFVHFDDSLIESVVQMIAPKLSSAPSEWSDLLRQINAFTNELLVELTRYYEDDDNA